MKEKQGQKKGIKEGGQKRRREEKSGRSIKSEDPQTKGRNKVKQGR